MIYILSTITCFALSLLWPSLNTITEKTTVPKPALSVKPTALKTVATTNSTLKQVTFDQLPGWNEAEVKKSLTAFQMSCKTFLKQAPTAPVGSHNIHLQAKDWQPACKAALSADELSAKSFFEEWFYPVEFVKPQTVHGLFTGYYMPAIKGNLTRTGPYTTPIYGLPSDLKQNSKHKSYYTREQIDNGAIQKKAPVIAWIKSPVERLFLEIEGSGVIQLTNGEKLYLGYAGENGAPYTSIFSVLIKKGVVNKDNASKNAVKRYLESQPKQANNLLHSNKSFVFFQDLKQSFALGARGIALTPGYSLAIDRNWIPLGAPLWLNTVIPEQQTNSQKKFQRLMIAQDTGGAIKGVMRGDIYWGSGKKATFLAENMKNKGHFWLLLPKKAFDKFRQLTRF